MNTALTWVLRGACSVAKVKTEAGRLLSSRRNLGPRKAVKRARTGATRMLETRRAAHGGGDLSGTVVQRVASWGTARGPCGRRSSAACGWHFPRRRRQAL